MKSDIQLHKDVLDELAFEPQLDATHIGIAVKDGIVTLTGEVSSYADRWTAERVHALWTSPHGVVKAAIAHARQVAAGLHPSVGLRHSQVRRRARQHDAGCRPTALQRRPDLLPQVGAVEAPVDVHGIFRRCQPGARQPRAQARATHIEQRPQMPSRAQGPARRHRAACVHFRPDCSGIGRVSKQRRYAQGFRSHRFEGCLQPFEVVSPTCMLICDDFRNAVRLATTLGNARRD